MYKISKVKVQQLMLERWGTAEQKELAERVGLTEATVSRLLAGSGFSNETLNKMCGALNCTPNDILVGQGLPDTHAHALAGVFA